MTAAVVIERSKPLLSFDSSPGRRRWGQLGLVLLMLVALVAVIVARSGGDRTPAAGGLESAGPFSSATPGASATPTTRPTPGPSDGSAGGSAAPSANSTATPRPAPTAAPATSPAASAGTTYTVKRGDTLSSIAVRFGTTVAAIQELNGIADPSLIRVGEVLEIP
jgi:nucleoid-associated protein YgaU